MSGFYVGQRVRFVRPQVDGIENRYGIQTGDQGTVTATDIIGDLPDSDIAVCMDRVGEAKKAASYCFEPIVPPGMESIEETLALWLPEGVSA